MTLDEIGRKRILTRERIRQIRRTALGNLQEKTKEPAAGGDG
jgi:DNA-directed RNA polymerase sigma subunit (sigma70/sigma32)